MKTKQIRVSASSPVPQLAGSIAASIDSREDIEIRAVGAAAVNQMYKAIAAARGKMAAKGMDILIRPGFDTIRDETGEEKTIMLAKIVIQ